MRGRELYGRYHRLIGELAVAAASGSDWATVLPALLKQFESEAATLESGSARLLREELCEQLEQEAFTYTHPQARNVLLAAVKRLEAHG